MAGLDLFYGIKGKGEPAKHTYFITKLKYRLHHHLRKILHHPHALDATISASDYNYVSSNEILSPPNHYYPSTASWFVSAPDVDTENSQWQGVYLGDDVRELQQESGKVRQGKEDVYHQPVITVGNWILMILGTLSQWRAHTLVTPPER